MTELLNCNAIPSNELIRLQWCEEYNKQLIEGENPNVDKVRKQLKELAPLVFDSTVGADEVPTETKTSWSVKSSLTTLTATTVAAGILGVAFKALRTRGDDPIPPPHHGDEDDDGDDFDGGDDPIDAPDAPPVDGDAGVEEEIYCIATRRGERMANRLINALQDLGWGNRRVDTLTRPGEARNQLLEQAYGNHRPQRRMLAERALNIFRAAADEQDNLRRPVRVLTDNLEPATTQAYAEHLEFPEEDEG